MSALAHRKQAVVAVVVLSTTFLMAMVISGALLVAPAPHTVAPLTLASGSTQQWAFGGNASAAISCTGAACGAGSNITSLSLHYYVGWVVIYSATNISSTQTEFEAQAAVNASLSLSISACVNEGTGTCSQISASANLAGKETAGGFTNITNAGTVLVTAGPVTPGAVPALAIMNAQSSAAFNFSGSYTETLPVNGTPETANANFDFGGNELSSVVFSTPLGIVPITPQPGEWWNSTAAFNAMGSYTSGYSLSVSGGGHSAQESSWKKLDVSPSGTLTVNGTDLGEFNLTDNYTSPPTQVTAQEILLTFGAGEFTGTDGWLMLPSGLYGGVTSALGGTTLIAGQHPSQGSTLGGGESPYYQSGVGFIGVSEAANTSALGIGSSGGPGFSLTAGPEPVSVAEQQYQAITANGAGGSSGFPLLLLLVGVVVAVVVVLGLVLAVRRSRGRPPVPMIAAGDPSKSMAQGSAASPSEPAPSDPSQPRS
ncbi:MAG: hypothetical protein ACREDE_06805 [Thermoplasmata archaeon]